MQSFEALLSQGAKKVLINAGITVDQYKLWVVSRVIFKIKVTCVVVFVLFSGIPTYGAITEASSYWPNHPVYFVLLVGFSMMLLLLGVVVVAYRNLVGFGKSYSDQQKARLLLGILYYLEEKRLQRFVFDCRADILSVRKTPSMEALMKNLFV